MQPKHHTTPSSINLKNIPIRTMYNTPQQFCEFAFLRATTAVSTRSCIATVRIIFQKQTKTPDPKHAGYGVILCIESHDFTFDHVTSAVFASCCSWYRSKHSRRGSPDRTSSCFHRRRTKSERGNQAREGVGRYSSNLHHAQVSWLVSTHIQKEMANKFYTTAVQIGHYSYVTLVAGQQSTKRNSAHQHKTTCFKICITCVMTSPAKPRQLRQTVTSLALSRLCIPTSGLQIYSGGT